MASSNASILSAMWLNGTSDYQQRVPSPTVATQAQQAEAIFAPSNGAIYNQFVDTLINRVGMSYVRQQSWRNPLAAFKRGPLPFGQTVQELQVKWVSAHTYADDKQTLLRIHRPEVEAAYHSISREDQYPISVNRVELRRAFVEDGGLNQLIAAVMDAPVNSEQYDEYRQMLELISWYENAWGFYKISMSAPDDDTSSKAFLKSLKATVARLAFPSSRYNAQILDDLPVFARPEELVLLTTPEAAAAVDVDALATLFHLEPADARVRRVIVDEFPIPGAYAMLTTEDWFQVYDVAYENGSFYNPETLTTNYYLTVMQVISCSPFVPAIVWTTEAGTDVGTITQTVETNAVDGHIFLRNSYGRLDEVTVTDGVATIDLAPDAAVKQLTGDNEGIFVRGVLRGSLSDGTTSGVERIGNIEVKPDAAAMTVTGLTIGGAAVTVNSRSRVDRLGRLKLQKAAVDAIGAGTAVTATITLESTYRNPSGDTPTVTPTEVTVNFSSAPGPTPPGPSPDPFEPGFYADGFPISEGGMITTTGDVQFSVTGTGVTESTAADITVDGGEPTIMTWGGMGMAATITFTAGEHSVVITASDGTTTSTITCSVTMETPVIVPVYVINSTNVTALDALSITTGMGSYGFSISAEGGAATQDMTASATVGASTTVPGVWNSEIMGFEGTIALEEGETTVTLTITDAYNTYSHTVAVTVSSQ